MTYTVEPSDHWRAGDRAYCVHGIKRNGRFFVETGRVYTVSKAEQYRGMMNDGLWLVEAESDRGFISSRFVCIRGRELPIKQLARRMKRSWCEAYSECRDARNALRDSGSHE